MTRGTLRRNKQKDQVFYTEHTRILNPYAMNISAKHSIRLAVTLTVEIHNHKQKILRKCTSKIL